jgi:flavin reductase (DIM6/NTAB) family NADH-FMN oxidoreductase RutF
LENGTFSINFPSTAMLAESDYCGIVSGRDVDKAALFEVFYGALGNAPMIAECPVSLECRVIKEFSIQHRQVFVGEVVQTHVSDHLVQEVDGKVQIGALPELDPIIYALDNRYYRIGEVIGTGYQEGKKLV